jgi:mono/diheme cytochrome c family protein
MDTAMRRGGRRAWLGLLLLCGAGARGGGGEERLLQEIEMGAVTAPRPSIEVDARLARRFEKQYWKAEGGDLRPLFDAWVPRIGTAYILAFLERSYPLCHGQSHDLGRAVFAHFRDVNAAIAECGKGCTSGCMHGVLMEAFGGGPEDCRDDPDSGGAEAIGEGVCATLVEASRDIEEVARSMDTFCVEGDMARLHEPGNCAHGIGHALMVVTDHDFEQSLRACASATDPAMGYYCATGVFMEALVTDQRDDPIEHGLHHPCDAGSAYPAACYRYQGHHMRRALDGDTARMIAECLALPARDRRGCFHGLGAAHLLDVAREPQSLADVCLHGTHLDQAFCVEGAIEKLADFRPDLAAHACRPLLGEIGEVCRSAAEGGMYRLDKPLMPYYTEGAADPPATERAARELDPGERSRRLAIRDWLRGELGSAYDRPVEPASSAQLVNGARLYHFLCSSCHGKRGAGDGPAAERLLVRPTDLTGLDSRGFYSDQGRLYIIRKGIAESPMIGWDGVLGEDELLNVFQYVRSLVAPEGDAP